MSDQGIFDELVAAARRIDLGSNSPGNSPSIVAGFGVPTAVEATGSVYYRQDAPNAALMLYVRTSGAWWPLVAGSPGNNVPVVARSPLSGGPMFRLWFPGDSIAEGFNGGDPPAGHGYQYHLARRLRSVRGDVLYVGTQEYPDYGTAGLNNPIGSVNPGEYSPMDWENEGHSGFTMPMIQAALAGWLATIGVIPDVSFFALGANTGGHSAATMANVDLPAMIAAARLLMPSTVFLVSTIPPQGAGKVVAAAYNNLIIANAAALAAPFNDPLVRFVDCCSDFTAAECGPDLSIHPNQFGYAKMADRMGDGIEAVLPTRAGPVWPRERRPRVLTTEQGIIFNDPTDAASGVNAGTNIGSDSFAIDFEITPLQSQLERAVGLATFRHILSAGDFYNTGISIIANGNDLEIYLGAGGPKLQDVPGSFGKPGVPARVLVHCDIVAGIVSLWVDGTLRSIVTGVAAWAFALGNAFRLGYNPSIGQDAYPCVIRDLRFHRGAQGMPLYAPGTLRMAAEKSAVDGIPLAGTSAWFRCDDSPIGTAVADVLGGGSLTLSGAKFTSAPEPGSLPEPSGSLEIIEPTAPTGRDMIGPLCTLDLDAGMGVTITGGKVSNWQDQSLAGAHSFLQAVAGNRPTKVEDGINGRPGIAFTAASTSKLSCVGPLSTLIQAGNWHIFVVAQFTQFSGRNDPVNLYANDNLITEVSTHIGISGRSGAGTPKIGAWKIHIGPAYDNTTETVITAGLPYIFEYSWDNTALSFQLRAAGGILGTTPQNEPGITKAGVLTDLTGAVNLGVDYTGTLYTDAVYGRIIAAKQRLPIPVASRVRQQLGQFYRI